MSFVVSLFVWGNAIYTFALATTIGFALLQVSGVLGWLAGADGHDGESDHDIDADTDHDVDVDHDTDVDGDHDAEADADHDGDDKDKASHVRVVCKLMQGPPVSEGTEVVIIDCKKGQLYAAPFDTGPHP